MSSSPSTPWPVQTTPPASSSSSSSSKKRKRSDSSHSTSKVSRQLALGDQVDAAAQRCQFSSGNDVVSCFPTTDTIIPQGQWASVVWNSRLPDFTQTNRVDIFLFRADSQQQILHYPNVLNPYGRAGVQTAPVNDSWWGDDGSKWNGSNLSYPFYWMVVRSDRGIQASDSPQARFAAVQTTYADSVIASSLSIAAASSSSASSASAAASSIQGTSTGTPHSSLAPDGSNSSDFPHWAIALIVVLGFLALACLCVLTFFLLRRHRRREYQSQRNSMSSRSPMMENKDHIPSPQSPVTSSGHAHHPHELIQPLAPASIGHDGASTISRANSTGEQAPFSVADAAIMADAFRQALRKPDFAGRPVEEGESPDDHDSRRNNEDVINRELAEEGRDIRSVSSSRGVRVETLSDSASTAHGHDVR